MYMSPENTHKLMGFYVEFLVLGVILLYTPYSARMSPEITHQLMGFYMEVLILGVILQYMVSAFLSCFL